MKKRLLIKGDHIHDIPSFYAEINRVLMQNEDWKIGNSLDAFNDLMYGGFGELKQDEPVQLVWQNTNRIREVLGLEATKTFYLEKLANPSIFNIRLFHEKLIALEKGDGPTFFEIVIKIVAEHPNIEWIEE